MAAPGFRIMATKAGPGDLVLVRVVTSGGREVEMAIHRAQTAEPDLTAAITAVLANLRPTPRIGI